MKWFAAGPLFTELRYAFDRTFQLPYQLKANDVEPMIAFRTAGVALA